MSQNVFSALFKFGPGAEENYLTEAFVFLLKLLLEREPDAGLLTVNQLCGLPREVHFENSKSINISTQVTVDEGRLDIEITGDRDTLVYIEIKHDSSLGQGQLEYYKARLQESGASIIQLVLLTRSRMSTYETSLDRNDFHHVCWYEIYNCLSNIKTQDQTCQYFIHSFINFLEGKQMSMNKVGWEYIQGMPALNNLMAMIEAAIHEAPLIRINKRTGGWGWRGFSLYGVYWCGVRFNQPLQVVFENKGGTNPTYKRDLDLEQIHFFSLNKDEQFECIVKFLQQSSIDAPKEELSGPITVSDSDLPVG